MFEPKPPTAPMTRPDPTFSFAEAFADVCRALPREI